MKYLREWHTTLESRAGETLFDEAVPAASDREAAAEAFRRTAAHPEQVAELVVTEVRPTARFRIEPRKVGGWRLVRVA